MHAVFPYVLFGSIGLFVVVGLLSMLTRNNLHDQIGQGGLFVGEEPLGGGRSPSGPPLAAFDGDPALQAAAGDTERELEIRQLLQARSDRLVRQGHPPLDIDAELARLDMPGDAQGPADAALTSEVRQLVLARNERRKRQGLAALDVEAEVKRTLAELGA